MKKLVFVLLAFLAVFTYISSLEKADASENTVLTEMPVEFAR